MDWERLAFYVFSHLRWCGNISNKCEGVNRAATLHGIWFFLFQHIFWVFTSLWERCDCAVCIDKVLVKLVEITRYEWIHAGMMICLDEGCQCVNRTIWVLIVSGARCPTNGGYLFGPYLKWRVFCRLFLVMFSRENILCKHWIRRG